MKKSLFERHWQIWGTIWRTGDRVAATYWFALQDMPDKAFVERSRHAIREFKFFPTPAEILEIPIKQSYHKPAAKLPDLSPEERLKSADACRKVTAYVKQMCSKSDSVPLAGTHGSVKG